MEIDGGYAVLAVGNSNGITFMHHVVVQETPDGYEVHHLNETKLDDQKNNLVLLTKAQHRQLRAIKDGRFLGVCWDKLRSMWRADIRINKNKNF